MRQMAVTLLTDFFSSSYSFKADLPINLAHIWLLKRLLIAVFSCIEAIRYLPGLSSSK